ncbi:MAG: hypothetical protein FJZ04_00140 [Candidatus Moranbacteria bacterium]|nr:hypothetical protein [Candidatus Moranbacteria bacterium]
MPQNWSPESRIAGNGADLTKILEQVALGWKREGFPKYDLPGLLEKYGISPARTIDPTFIALWESYKNGSLRPEEALQKPEQLLSMSREEFFLGLAEQIGCLTKAPKRRGEQWFQEYLAFLMKMAEASRIYPPFGGEDS